MENNRFEYNYVALSDEDRASVEKIRSEYLPKTNAGEENSIARLKKLHSKVQNVPTMLALVFGIIGTLIFGLGMAMVLEWDLLLWGSVVGVVGLALLVSAYPMYKRTDVHMRNKYGKEIIEISNSILEDK